MSFSINNIKIDVFQHATEDKDKLFIGLKNILPDKFHENIEKIVPPVVLEGFHKNEIIRYTFESKKKKDVESIFHFLMKKILKTNTHFSIFERIAEDGTLHLRLNKQINIADNSLELDSSSDVYKIIIKFSFFGQKKNKVDEIINLLSSFSPSE